MKYVRTKDNKIVKFDYTGEQDFFQWTQQFENYKDNVLKISDDLEDLCDSFVIVYNDENYNPLLCDDLVWTLVEARNSIGGYKIYGAIWTDKGLIYVAKLDDKGDLELI